MKKYKSGERWKPEMGEKYWTIACCKVAWLQWGNDSTDINRSISGFVFQTQSQAEEALKKIKIVLCGLHNKWTKSK